MVRWAVLGDTQFISFICSLLISARPRTQKMGTATQETPGLVGETD